MNKPGSFGELIDYLQSNLTKEVVTLGSQPEDKVMEDYLAMSKLFIQHNRGLVREVLDKHNNLSAWMLTMAEVDVYSAFVLERHKRYMKSQGFLTPKTIHGATQINQEYIDKLFSMVVSTLTKNITVDEEKDAMAILGSNLRSSYESTVCEILQGSSAKIESFRLGFLQHGDTVLKPLLLDPRRVTVEAPASYFIGNPKIPVYPPSDKK